MKNNPPGAEKLFKFSRLAVFALNFDTRRSEIYEKCEGGGIEVEQPVTRLPPHRPRRAELPQVFWGRTLLVGTLLLNCITLAPPTFLQMSEMVSLFTIQALIILYFQLGHFKKGSGGRP